MPPMWVNPESSFSINLRSDHNAPLLLGETVARARVVCPLAWETSTKTSYEQTKPYAYPLHASHSE
jgi:hypothetical protein